MAGAAAGTAFKFVGGALCLDFINTVSGRLAHPAPGGHDYLDVIEVERLVDFPALTRWGLAAGIVSVTEANALNATASASPATARQVLARGRALREALYRVFKAGVEQWIPRAGDLAVVNRELARARRHERLKARSKGAPLTTVWTTERSVLDRVLWPVIRSASDLLTSDRLARVRQCGGEDCHWLFLDTSRNRSRRWCEMAECGNRAKVRRFRGGG
jgi:predicted RNA-binding Zn ribbon-like protein